MSEEIHSGLSRRAFLEAAAGAAAVGVIPLVAPHASGRNTAWAGAADQIKVGVIGCGGRGTGAATNALNADPGVIIWSMGDAFEDRVNSSHKSLEGFCAEKDEEENTKTWAGRLQAPPERRFSGLDCYKKVIESGVDVVLLCSSPAFRPAHIAAAVAAGKHIFTEKPMATDATGLRSVMESARLAKEKKLCVMSGFCWRYNLAEQATMEQVHNGALGDVVMAYSNYNSDGFPSPKARKPEWSDLEYQVRNWHYYTWLSGDHIAEQAIHAIDWLCWLNRNQPPETCVAAGGRQVRTGPEYGNVYDHFAVTYEYTGGRRFFHMARHWPNTARDNSLYVHGTKGRLTMHPWTPVHQIEGETNWKYAGPSVDMYDNEHKVLFKAIRESKQHWDGDWMCTSTLMAIMGRMAAYTGQNVSWKQALESKESLVPSLDAWGQAPKVEVAMPGQTKLI